MHVFTIHLLITCILTFFLNIPFGYVRARHKKFSLMWFVCIHVPVPIVVLIRFLNEVHLSWIVAPFLIASYFSGQFAGKKLYLTKGHKANQQI